jgi:hypothetical protein
MMPRNGCSRSRGTGAQHPWNAHLDVSRSNQHHAVCWDMSFGQAAFAPFHEPDVIRSVALDLVWPAEGEVKERLGFLLIVASGYEFRGDTVPRTKGLDSASK